MTLIISSKGQMTLSEKSKEKPKSLSFSVQFTNQCNR